ncbi:MAG: ABC transporter substrate-binding protein [Acidimicrobiia bacterium]|nr:ABC transporter substrate-binding protein [Acidimicrobiia bacterium]
MDSTMVKRYGPLVAIVAVLALVAVVTLTGGDDDDGPDEVVGGETTNGGYRYDADWGGEVVLPEGVIPFSVAEREGLDIDWPETCDTDTGLMAVPSFFAQECFAPFDGDNGGATAPGVTEDTIRVVLYQATEDPILDAISGAATDDTPEEVTATHQAYLPLFQEYYETYGREVELIVYEGTGGALDDVAARADAVQIAETLEPFAVWGGPIIGGAFADELAARDILNLGLLGPSEPPSYYEAADPYLLTIGMAAWQAREHTAEYIGKRLAGEPAIHAGDEAMHDQERVFGLIYLDSGPGSGAVVQGLEDALEPYGVELAVTASFQNPLDVSSEAPGVIARLKDAGVTTVLQSGDPLSPAGFTRAATDQDYFPEWFVGNSALMDTAVYARTYDQQQWANAFGITSGTVRVTPELENARRLLEWYTCAPPPAPDTTPLVYPLPAVFFATLQGAGPNLTHETFRQTLFQANATRRALSNPTLAWGTPEKGRWDEVDYHGVDDMTELWWNPTEVGPDDTAAASVGPGLYAYVDGGRRYLPGEWPEGPPAAFDEDGAVYIYDEVPEDERFVDYPSPCA